MISDIRALKLADFTIEIGISGVPTPTFPSALNDFTATGAEITPDIIENSCTLRIFILICRICMVVRRILGSQLIDS